jgi:hypothetical protein
VQLQKMPMRAQEQRERQAQPGEEEECSGASVELQEAHCRTLRKRQASAEEDKLVVGEGEGAEKQEPVAVGIEPDAKELTKGNEGQPQHEDAHAADHRASQQSPQ